METTQREIQLRKLGIDLQVDNIKMYLNRCEGVKVTHLGHYTVRQRATMKLWVPRKVGIPLPGDSLPAYGVFCPLWIPLLCYLVTGYMVVLHTYIL